MRPIKLEKENVGKTLHIEPDDTWVQPPTRRRIVTWTEPGYLFISDFASSTLLMRHYTSVSESVFYLVNADKDEQQQPTRVWPPKGTTASVKCGRLWTDVSGRVTGVIFASDEGGEFATLRYYDIASQKTKELISAEQVPWDVEDRCCCGGVEPNRRVGMREM